MNPRAMPPGLMIAAPASGAGETPVMLGLLRAVRNADLVLAEGSTHRGRVSGTFLHLIAPDR